MTEQPILSVQDLTIALPKGADRPFAVKGVSFDLRRGEILCIVGESGSGKSVLSSSIMGAPPEGLSIAQGSVQLAGLELTTLGERQLRHIRGNRIAMIFQEPMAALNPAFPVGRQIEEVFELHDHLPAAERRRRTLALLESMQLPDPARIADSFPHQLSGGQCQRAIIAMALAMNPEVLIADEPTTALDVTTQAQVLKLIRQLRERQGHGILFITHDFGVVAEIADRIAVMRMGEMVEIGEAKQILTNPSHPYTKSLIAAVPSLAPQPRAQLGREVPVLQVDNLRKSYGGRVALDGVSFSLAAGRTLSIVGESGCGKSTLARLIMRLTAPGGGSVEVNGVDHLNRPPTALRLDVCSVQMVFQDPHGSLNPRRSIGATIARAARLAGADRRAARQRAEDLLDQVGLSRSAYHRRPKAFSGGQRQRVGIARALAMNPQILIADESVSALDVSVQTQILALLKSLQTRLGVSILFITHDLRVAAQISDEIAVIQHGKIVEIGCPTEVLAAPKHPYTRQLVEAAPGRGMV
jgi:peptide/nickel transport system ATP-binding protein